MHDDVYQMYLEEIALVPACTKEEKALLLEKLAAGEESARSRLLEGSLGMIVEQAKAFANQGLPMGDLIQEANIAFILTADRYVGGDFDAQVQAGIQEALKAAIEEQKAEAGIQEEMLARVNVLQEVSRRLAEELGREATVTELAQKMKMTEEQIKDIMKLTLDAMSVSPDAVAAEDTSGTDSGEQGTPQAGL